MKIQLIHNNQTVCNIYRSYIMSYFTPFGKAFLPARTERNNEWFTDRSRLNPQVFTPNDMIIDLFPEMTRLLQRQQRNASFMDMIEKLYNESFPMVSDSSELDHTYVVNVPEITSENDITIDVSDDKKQIDVTIEVKRQDDKTNAVETMHYSWRSAREIDIDNMEAFLDRENNQLSIYSPYVIEDDYEETTPEPEETIVNIAINKGDNDNCDCEDQSCCDYDEECDNCKIEENRHSDSSQEDNT